MHKVYGQTRLGYTVKQRKQILNFLFTSITVLHYSINKMHISCGELLMCKHYLTKTYMFKTPILGCNCYWLQQTVATLCNDNLQRWLMPFSAYFNLLDKSFLWYLSVSGGRGSSYLGSTSPLSTSTPWKLNLDIIAENTTLH